MTFALVIALNLSLSILALLVVAGCTLLAYRLPENPTFDGDWRDWASPIPVALAAEDAADDRHLGRYSAAA